jgi:hypothetical protein
VSGVYPWLYLLNLYAVEPPKCAETKNSPVVMVGDYFMAMTFYFCAMAYVYAWRLLIHPIETDQETIAVGPYSLAT